MRGLTLRDPGFLGSLKKFSPFDLQPIAWFDASDTSTIVGSGSPLKVSQWTGKSANTLNLTQVTSTAQPSSGISTINGLNTITFDGNDRLAVLDANFFSNRDGATVFIIAKGTVASAGNKALLTVRTSSGDAARAQILAVSGQIQTGGRRLDADLYQSVNASTVADNTPFMAGAVFDWANAQLYTNINGVLTQRVGGFQTAGFTSNTLDDIGIGQNPRSTGNTFTGSIGEIIVYPRVLLSAERVNVENYLRAKWGTP